MTTAPEAADTTAAQPITSPAKPEAANSAELTPAVAWSRRVRRIGGFIQAAFAAFWLVRASLAIGGRAEDVLIAVSGVAVIGVFPTPSGSPPAPPPGRPDRRPGGSSGW
jgi:hypothetical protein